MNNMEPDNSPGDGHPDTFIFINSTYRPSATRGGLSAMRRGRKVRRAVSDSLKRRTASEPGYDELASLVIMSEPLDAVAGRKPGKQLLLPERRDPHDVDAFIGPPMMAQTVFEASRFKVLSRIFVYLAAAIQWYAMIFRDRLRGNDTIERRAVRLREIIVKLQGTAVKIGQQMAMRIDLMPYIYGVELSKMLDKVPPFETDYAVKRIEAVTGKPLGETFAEFEPEPIGSASVACVYRAVLHTGETVAIKVRRPNIGETFVADCQALAWIFRLLEFLTLMRPGLSHNFLFEFRNMLIEELDFVKEARHTELFRRRVHKRLSHVTAPRVYFDLSGDDVLVMEFVTGIWVGDLIAFVEHKDAAALAQLRRLNIDPEKVSRKLFRVNQFCVYENILFHADPHPSNILIRPNNTIVFIDFGAVGAYTTMERNNWRQLNYYHQREDIGRMAQSALALLEPLPPIDIDEFRQRLEKVFWQDLYAFKSKNAKWFERTSIRIWMSFLELTREYNVPMNLNTLRMIRSTLLYDTVCARLFPKVNTWRENRKYMKSTARRARRRVRRGFFKRLCGGPTKSDYQRIEQIQGLCNRTLYLYQRWLDNPLYRFSLLIKKAVYAITNIIKAGVTLISATLGWLILWLLVSTVSYVSQYGVSQSWVQYRDNPVVKQGIKYLLWDSHWARLYWLIVLISLFLNSRRILFRFNDKDIRRRNTSGLN